MAVRKAEAQWQGTLREGKGTMKLGSGAFEGNYSFASRFEEETGTNPEELIAAAHAGCFSMAFSAGLTKAGFTPNRVHTTAKAHLEKVGEGFEITTIDLEMEAEVPNLDEKTFQEQAEAAKNNCPVSKLYKGAKINMNARLLQAAQ